MPDPGAFPGKTRWRRFGIAFGGSFGILVVFLALLATGVVAAPIVISGTTFKVAATSLTIPAGNQGTNAFVQYANVDVTPGGSPTAVATTVLSGAQLSNLDQTVCGPTGLPAPIDNLLVRITANPATASSMVVDATQLTGDATFSNIQIGVPVNNPRTGQTTFGQTADNVTINNLNQTAVYTSAGTFVLTGLNLTASFTHTCP